MHCVKVAADVIYLSQESGQYIVFRARRIDNKAIGRPAHANMAPDLVYFLHPQVFTPFKQAITNIPKNQQTLP